MHDASSPSSSSLWPLPKYYFEILWDNVVMSFQEVSGLETQTAPIVYRHEDGPFFSTIRMPGINSNNRVTLKKGLFKGDNPFWDWFNQVKMNTIERKTVTIRLLDEAGKPTMVWTLNTAWPIKITGTDIRSTGHEVSIETLEIAHEGISMSTT